MAIQAFDKDGNRIPFAIYDTDYTVEVPDEPVEQIAVDVSLGNVNSLGVLLDVRDREGKLVGKVMTAEEIIGRAEWRIGVVHHTHYDEIKPMIGQKIADTCKLMSDLTTAFAARTVANYEAYAARNLSDRVAASERYSKADALYRLRLMIANTAVYVTFGVRPGEFTKLGLN